MEENEKEKENEDAASQESKEDRRNDLNSLLFVSVFFGILGIDRFLQSKIITGIIKFFAGIITLWSLYVSIFDVFELEPNFWGVAIICTGIVWWIADILILYNSLKRFDKDNQLKTLDKDNQLKTLDKDKKAEKTNVFSAIIGIFILACLFLIFTYKEDPDLYKRQDNSTSAYIMCQKFVKDKLKSPSSAVFPDTYAEIKRGAVKKLDEQEYQIISYVDAQNSFGAMIRTVFIAKLKQIDNNTWRNLGVELIDE